MNDRKNSNNGNNVSAPATMKLSDIYFILFRHKWKIVCLSTLGILGAVGLYFLKPPLYTSAGKVYVRSVVESDPLGSTPGHVINGDPQGNNLMGSEVEILTSLDVAQDVVKTVGAAKILEGVGGGDDFNQAAGFVKKNIAVVPTKHTDTMLIIFQHPTKAVVQPILTAVIDAYIERDRKIHNNISEGSINFLNQQVSEARSELADTSEALKQAEAKAGVISLEDAKKANSTRISRLQDDIVTAQASLAEHAAALRKITGTKTPVVTIETNATHEVAVPADKIAEYRNACFRLEELNRDRQLLLGWATTNNVFVTDKQAQITATEQEKSDLETKFPKLADVAPLPTAISSTGSTVPALDPTAEAVQVDAFQAKLKFLTNELTQVQNSETRVEQWAATIEDLQTRRDLQEAKYRKFSAKLEDARLSEQSDAAKITTISIVQSPSPAYRDMMALYKLLGMVVGSGLLGGIGLAFLIEMFIDPTFKRASEIEAKLHAPLFLSIPDTSRNGYPNGFPAPNQKLLTAPNGNGESVPSTAVATTRVALWDANHHLRPFFEALRDRLVGYFDMNNLTHNPKIIAITSCGEGAGVSTVAAGLAATLSETGEGNVLLVDMNQGKGAAALDFHKGRPALNIAEALEKTTRDGAMVQDNLYVVREGNGSDKNLGILPKQFAYLVPKLRASDYDYIIFDMPPVSQISVTSKLARLMDVNLLVVESEKTGRIFDPSI